MQTYCYALKVKLTWLIRFAVSPAGGRNELVLPAVNVPQ